MDETTPAAEPRILLLGELRCARCSARCAEVDAACRNCGLAFAAPGTPPAPGPAAERRSARAVLAVLAWLGASLAALSIAVAARPAAAPTPPEEHCADRLAELRDRLSAFPDLAGSPRTGSAFWDGVALAGGACCPAIEDAPRYRGPARRWSELPPEGVVASDPEGAHGAGARYLTKDGRIGHAAFGTDEYRRVMAATAR